MVILRNMWLLLVWSLVWLCSGNAAEQWIVQAGEPRAEIVLAEKPTRSADLAAAELQAYVEKLSGATLPIVRQPNPTIPVRLYVGESHFTRELGLTTHDLDHGAYRLISGDNWLALIGDDLDFVPPEPWARTHGDWHNKLLPQWDALTGSHWGNPIAAGLRKEFDGHARSFDPNGPRYTKNGDTGLWSHDEHGSLNAVYHFLRRQGIRWYMPGELGEIVPQTPHIPLPQLAETVRPAFPVRMIVFGRYGPGDQDSVNWSMRMGINNPYGFQLAHGLRDLTDRQEMMDEHPEYYALYGNRRNTIPHKANQCLSSPGLFEETVQFTRLMFDTYNMKMVSLMPSDGFTRLCQCQDCLGKDTPEREQHGHLSDYVWDFINRVAIEVYKTHPDRLVSGTAYSRYRLPPLHIDKLSPNVLVCLVLGRPRDAGELTYRESLAELRHQWREKTAHDLVLWQNYPQYNRGTFVPAYWPHIAAQGIRDARQQIQGELDFLPAVRGLDQPAIGHLNAYVLSRLLWEPDLDLDALLAEYYPLFYGPAAREMERFILFCEDHYDDLFTSSDAIEQALAHLDAATRSVDPQSVYGQRIAPIDHFLERLRNRNRQLKMDRDDVPEWRMANFDNDRWQAEREALLLDGKLDDAFWTAHNRQAVVRRTRSDQDVKGYHSIAKARWWNHAIYLGIRCYTVPGYTPVITATQHDDPAMLQGDYLSVLLESTAHSFYEIAVNPAGVILDADHHGDAPAYNWDSQAEAYVHLHEDGWSIELVIPIMHQNDDPLHIIDGRKPPRGLPWFINLGRQHLDGDNRLFTTFSPIGEQGFYDAFTLGKLYLKK